MSLVRRDYFQDALTIYEHLGRAEGRDISDVDYWHKLQAPRSAFGATSTPGKTPTTQARRAGAGAGPRSKRTARTRKWPLPARVDRR